MNILHIGLLFIGISIIWYIAHAMIYNHFLRKHNPDLFDESLRSRQHSDNRNKKVTIFITSGKTPVWVMLFGIFPIPILLLGILITIVALIINIL